MPSGPIGARGYGAAAPRWQTASHVADGIMPNRKAAFDRGIPRQKIGETSE